MEHEIYIAFKTQFVTALEIELRRQLNPSYEAVFEADLVSHTMILPYSPNTSNIKWITDSISHEYLHFIVNDLESDTASMKLDNLGYNLATGCDNERELTINSISLCCGQTELDSAIIFEDLPNCEPLCLKLDDLALETQIELLEFLKRFKDAEKGKTRGKGFANAQILNPSRNPSIFTNAEAEFAKICDDFDVSYVHELRFSGKDSKNKTHHYKLDFYFPESRINVEISPNFHRTYKLVRIRDIIKKRVLKKAGIRTFTIRAYGKKRKAQIKGLIDRKYALKIIHLVQKAEISPESLEYWVFGNKY